MNKEELMQKSLEELKEYSVEISITVHSLNMFIAVAGSLNDSRYNDQIQRAIAMQKHWLTLATLCSEAIEEKTKETIEE